MSKFENPYSVIARTASATMPRPQNSFREPVAYLSRAAKYINLQKEPDPSDGSAVHLNRKVSALRFSRRLLYPLLCVVERVRVRESIAHVAPYLRVIGVPGQRLFIPVPPVANYEMAEIQFHGFPFRQ